MAEKIMILNCAKLPQIFQFMLISVLPAELFRVLKTKQPPNFLSQINILLGNCERISPSLCFKMCITEGDT